MKGVNNYKVRHAAERLWHEHEPYVRKICEKKLKSAPDIIDDCIQETFTALVEYLDKGKAIKNPKAWLGRVVNNIIADAYRYLKKEKETLVEFTPVNVDKAYSSNIDNDELLLTDDDTTLLKFKEQIISQLNEEETFLLYERYTLKKSISQIAK